MRQEFQTKFDREELDDIPTYIFQPREWFTNTSDYDYLFEFLQGIELASDFESADSCIDSLIAFYDDTTQFRNNLTLELNHIEGEDQRYLYPLLNFTGMVGLDLGDAVPFCFKFLYIEFLGYWSDLYTAMNNNFNTMLVSFLFSQMGNAKDFKSAIDKIAENEENQDYELVMFQYGRIVRLFVFEIQVLEERAPLNDFIESADMFKQIYPQI